MDGEKYEKIKGQMNMNRAFKGTVLAGISGFLASWLYNRNICPNAVQNISK